jgi:hypothetical protein
VVSCHVGGFPGTIRLSDKEAYWVVIPRGLPWKVLNSSLFLIPLIIPRTAVSAAMGTQGSRRLLRSGSRDQAERAFTEKYMLGEVFEIVEVVQTDTK